MLLISGLEVTSLRTRLKGLSLIPCEFIKNEHYLGVSCYLNNYPLLQGLQWLSNLDLFVISTFSVQKLIKYLCSIKFLDLQ